MALMEVMPEGPVDSLVSPRYVCPSPKPEGSAVALAKNWMLKVMPGVLLSAPETWRPLLPDSVADVCVGKF